MTNVENFRFRFDRALQSAAYLVKLAGGREYHIHLLKLLYIADREYLFTYGETITGDHVVAMKNGPVLSTVYDLIKGKVSQSEKWAKYLQTFPRSHTVRLRENPKAGSLCRASCQVLNNVYARYGKMPRFQLTDLTHEFPEWKHFFVNNTTSTPIPWEEILRLNGKSDMIKTAADYIKLDKYQQNLLGNVT